MSITGKAPSLEDILARDNPQQTFAELGDLPARIAQHYEHASLWELNATAQQMGRSAAARCCIDFLMNHLLKRATDAAKQIDVMRRTAARLRRCISKYPTRAEKETQCFCELLYITHFFNLPFLVKHAMKHHQKTLAAPPVENASPPPPIASSDAHASPPPPIASPDACADAAPQSIVVLDGGACVACMDAARTHVGRGCGHYCLCGTCAVAVNACPICRNPEPFIRLIVS